MKPSDFIHPEDAAALRQMENIPGFAALVKKVLAIGIETLQPFSYSNSFSFSSADSLMDSS